jgi:hypothetical protein
LEKWGVLGKVVENSDFQAYLSSIKPTLHEAINGLYMYSINSFTVHSSGIFHARMCSWNNNGSTDVTAIELFGARALRRRYCLK